MIKLEVEAYCEDCPEFTADVYKDFLYAADYPCGLSMTTIKCKHKERCENIKRYLEGGKRNK